jgi:AraC family transcriptional regulator of adaptative response / DNA-3-methyladenine glycosylase II
MVLDREICYRALTIRDERYDGRIYVAVTSTGIYCRPICPARTPKLENCRFFPSAAAAQEAGFRPCLRCRPEVAPDRGSWHGTSNTVSRGLALIAEGALDGEGANMETLALRLGVGERHLRRLFERHLGASPISVAQTRRVHFAKQLIHDTRLPMSEIAMASGFGSVRRFNEVFLALFGRPPSKLRRHHQTPLPAGSLPVSGVTVRLGYRRPFDWSAILAHLATRSVDGMEWVGDGAYWRTIEYGGKTGSVQIVDAPSLRSLRATIRFPSVKELPLIVDRIRAVFDLGADITAIGAHLSRDGLLAPLVAARPGLRVPGGWDGFELAVRTVLAQQISLRAARGLAAQLVRALGRPVASAAAGHSALTHAFPDPSRVADADLAMLKMPAARRDAVTAIARAAVEAPALFEPLADLQRTVDRLRAVPGIGEWTAHSIALRIAREPDAFPSSDAGLLRSVARRSGVRMRPHELRARAEPWRPWRAYAAQHLWAADSVSA